MGITNSSLNRLNQFECLQQGVKMLELGCQNIYASGFPEGTIAQDYWKSIGIDVTTWDILACNKAIVKDLREIIKVDKIYDIVTNYGTLEHIDGGIQDLYTAFYNVHTHCALQGLMVHEFPLVNHWPNNEGHWGYHWWTTPWVKMFADACAYEVIDSGIDYAMENHDTGGLIYCTYKKTQKKFMSIDEFANLYRLYLTHYNH